MNKPPYIRTTQPRPFWQAFLIVLGIDTLIVLSVASVFHDFRQISNFYFLSSIVLFIIAAIPVFSEVGSTAKITSRALKDNKKAAPLLKEKKPVFDRGARTTYVYGLAGLVTFLLSMLLLGVH